MYLNSGLEGEEAVYITSSDGFYKLRGYSIYYERNQMMQDYMISRKDISRVETGVNDRAIQDFRKKMEEHRGVSNPPPEYGGYAFGCVHSFGCNCFGRRCSDVLITIKRCMKWKV